ncbi:MAG TPA: MFS transporter [Terriglobales bacterium]|nr:MFS transporter [Terriglobales bacterium]
MRSPCDEAAIQSTGAETPCRKESRPWILAATILGSSMAFIDGTVVNVALPALQSSLHASVVDVQWVVESYGLFLAALILAGGVLGDMFGRRLMFLLGVSIFAAASIACAVAATINQLVIARSVQGVGAALMVPGSLSIISASFDGETRGKAIGTWSGFTAITTAIGPILGGWLIEHVSWRWVFWINIPLAAAVIVISLWHVPESRNPEAHDVDWLGAVTATVALAGLVYGLIDSSSRGWGHPLVWGSLIVGAGGLILFVLLEARERSPMVPLGLFKSRNFSGANLLTLFLYSALGIFFFLFPMNLIQVQGYSATATGAAALPVILLMFSLSRWSGGLVSRYGPRTPLIIGPLIAAAGFALFAVPSIGGSYWRTFFPGFLILGFGMAVSVAPLTTAVMSSVGQGRSGTASGVNNAVARLAGVLAIAVFGLVMIGVFSSRLNESLAKVSIPEPISHEIQSQEVRLAALTLPAGLDANTAKEVKMQISRAFVSGFRAIMLICATLSVASSVVAWRLISKRIEETA